MHSLRKYGLLVLGALCVIGMLFIDPIAQDLQYHNFSDAGTLFGIKNFHNTLTNLPIVIVGVLAIIWLIRNNGSLSNLQRAIYWILFLGIVFIGLGSGYYHLDPNNATLVWDRLPMTLVFVSFYALIIIDFYSLRIGKLVFLIFLPLGILSVVHWHITELNGAGDLRWYSIIQFYPMLTIPFIIFRKGVIQIHRQLVIYVLSLYALAKLAEFLDGAIHEFVGYSGHSIKHLIAAASLYYIFKYIAVKHKDRDVSCKTV